MRRLESLASDSATLGAYLQEIAQFPSVSGDEERALAERIQGDRDDAALSRLVGAHLRGVVRYARRYRSLGVPLLDLINDGNLALIDAARRFEPSRHGPFTAYAAWWVRQGIMHRLSAVSTAEGAGGPLDVDLGRHVEALQAALEHSLASAEGEPVDFSEDEVRRLDESGTRFAVSDEERPAALDVDEIVDGALTTEDAAGEDEIRAALLSELEAARSQVEITLTSVVEAEEDLRVQQERYRLGASTIVHVLTSQEALNQAEVDVVVARFDYLRAKASLEALIGRNL